jgi:hypothetical protein
MITLKESLLDKTSKKIKGMPDTIKRAQLELYGFPKFEDNDHGTWIWVCPEVFSKYNDKLNKEFGTNHNFIGVYWMDNPQLGVFPDETSIHIKFLTDGYEGGWPGKNSVTLMNIKLPYRESMKGIWNERIYDMSLKDIYDLLIRFALNMDDMLDYLLKEAKKNNFSDYKKVDIYNDLIKKFKI